MPGSFRFEPCPNCCVTGCVYASDNMDHADSTTLDAMWTETSGDWSYDTNRLKIAASTNVARVFVNNSGQFAELERITATCGRLRLYDGATCKGSVGVSLGGFTRLVLCIEGAKIHVGTGGSPMLTIPATATSDVVALGTGDGSKCTCNTAHPTGSKKLIVSVSITFDGAGNIFFEDFSLSKHADDDATCPACGNEGCYYHQIIDHTSSCTSDGDRTLTGTWTGDWTGSLVAQSDATWVVVPEVPVAAPHGAFQFWLDNAGSPGSAFVVRFHVDDDNSTYIEIAVGALGPSGFWKYRVVSVWSGGVAYGPSFVVDPGHPVATLIGWCYDGTRLTASLGISAFVQVPHSVLTFKPRIIVSGWASASDWMRVRTLVGWKDHDACLATSGVCGTPSCAHCSPGTFTNTARVVIANITSVDYGCTCTDVTINMTAAASGCSWTGTATGPCSSGTWTATATVSAVAGGYKLTVTVTTSTGVTATFENTVLSGSPVDCMTVFDGDVPWVSASGTLHCTLGSATLTFTSPAP